jgi:DNA polymerase III subunit epsilon
MQHRPLVFLDIETTGGSPMGSRITEIGAVRVEQNRVVDTFTTLINPEQKVPSYITRITGIDDAMVWNAPLFRHVTDDLDKLLDGALFVAHNVNFDYSFIKAEYGRCGAPFAMDRLCTVRLSRKLYPDQRRHNLDTVLARHNIQVKNRHRALGDAMAIFEFYKIALEQHQLNLFAAMDRLLVKHSPATAKRSRYLGP